MAIASPPDAADRHGVAGHGEQAPSRVCVPHLHPAHTQQLSINTHDPIQRLAFLELPRSGRRLLRLHPEVNDIKQTKTSRLGGACLS